ncbi:Prenylated rab acceptor PRA1 isoform A [Chlorella sorokiniana]|uniref:Prenylated rab acceptor PRA1 isoform A n=1 Tax=Chlorella sorokiniana TaxID=3076 RepID=A0A2P6U4A7_CHLSO|nr:Prenylated rab acceptor PRA1 isoform A [Chlorella sorokiniana]|eukprot:PRW61143.1 Prenylated rab acceptor PRA1 isoform A [Chlorella sorokiniana]
MGWLLRRSPLSSGVPLEGSDTVQGLRNLERMRLAELLQEPTSVTFASGRAGTSSTATNGGGWRRRFQRYRGPFIEQLAVEDLKADPKPWAVFWRGSESGRWAAAYNLPASLDVLHERTEENFVSFLPNYLRLAAAVLLATFYLRPQALLGAAALAVSMYRSISRALEGQAADAAAAQGGPRGRGGGNRGTAALAGAAGGAAADPNEQLITAGLTVVTWVLVAYTRCMPILILGMAASLVAVLVHCGLRRAPSEYRYKGRQLLGFTLRQLLGQEPVPEGCRPADLFREIVQASGQAAAARWQWAKRYARYYMLTAWDALRHPRSLLPPSTSSGLSAGGTEGSTEPGDVSQPLLASSSSLAASAQKDTADLHDSGNDLHGQAVQRRRRRKQRPQPHDQQEGEEEEEQQQQQQPTGRRRAPKQRGKPPEAAEAQAGQQQGQERVGSGPAAVEEQSRINGRHQPRSLETRQKMSASRKAMLERVGGFSPEWRQALSEAASRRRWGLDVRYRMSCTHSNRSPEVRAKMAAAQQRRRERERAQREAGAASGLQPGSTALPPAWLNEGLARERAVIEMSRLRRELAAWLPEFEAQYGRVSVAELERTNPAMYQKYVRFTNLRNAIRQWGSSGQK